MKVLIACEESQTVCKAFRERGFEAYSNDIKPCSGGHPEWHLQMDSMKALMKHEWDLVIAHPPCTYLTVAGNRWLKPEYSHRFPNRKEQRAEAVNFFLMFTNCADRIAIENPIGVMSTIYRKPDQIIQPYQFGDAERKATCLWLKNLPPLAHTNIVEPEIIYHKSGRTDGKLHFETLKLPKEERARIRSKTFQGIANAMAEQWGNALAKENTKAA